MKINEYIKIKEAAKYLGISEMTLRRWSDDGKVKCKRHPINGYRLFKSKDLKKLLEKLK
jgi:MerR family transcriptional regulator, copper efflux regulator